MKGAEEEELLEARLEPEEVRPGERLAPQGPEERPEEQLAPRGPVELGAPGAQQGPAELGE
jgi:hypothetical protein